MASESFLDGEGRAGSYWNLDKASSSFIGDEENGMVFSRAEDVTAKFMRPEGYETDNSNSAGRESVRKFIHIEKGKYQIQENYMYNSSKSSDGSLIDPNDN